jgi:hypothetical protein
MSARCPATQPSKEFIIAAHCDSESSRTGLQTTNITAIPPGLLSTATSPTVTYCCMDPYTLAKSRWRSAKPKRGKSISTTCRCCWCYPRPRRCAIKKAVAADLAAEYIPGKVGGHAASGFLRSWFATSNDEFSDRESRDWYGRIYRSPESPCGIVFGEGEMRSHDIDMDAPEIQLLLREEIVTSEDEWDMVSNQSNQSEEWVELSGTKTPSKNKRKRKVWSAAHSLL